LYAGRWWRGFPGGACEDQSQCSRRPVFRLLLEATPAKNKSLAGFPYSWPSVERSSWSSNQIIGGGSLGKAVRFCFWSRLRLQLDRQPTSIRIIFMQISNLFFARRRSRPSGLWHGATRAVKISCIKNGMQPRMMVGCIHIMNQLFVD